MGVILRDYQQDILTKVLASGGHPLVQLDTGAGKTPIIAALAEQAALCIVVAHRNELAVQASEKLAARGIAHDTISTEQTRRRAILRHRRAGHGRSIRRGQRTHLVASLLSLIALLDNNPSAIDTNAAYLIIIDEAHHVLPNNIWGNIKTRFPNARIVGFTGTPARYDGMPLHVDAGGLFTELIQADSLKHNSDRVLTERGFLAEFDAIYPARELPSLRDNGELAVAGDPVETYLKRAQGRRAIGICASISNAREHAAAFRSAGVSSAYIAHDLGASAVANILDRFASGEIEALFSVDMISEGFDMPEADVLIILAMTGSFVRYRQWVGRVRRPKADGRKSIIIDHVGAILTHGMPDDPVLWDINNPPSRASRLQQAPCPACGIFYPLTTRNCPDCGTENPLFSRSEGVGEFHLTLRQFLDAQMLERIKNEVRQDRMDDYLSSTLHIPSALCMQDNGCAVSRGVSKLVTWSADELLRAGVPLRKINGFLANRQVSRPEWWIKRFRIADIQQPAGVLKIQKEFAAWLKSQ